MADANRYYLVDDATWQWAQANLTRRAGRQNSWEILQDRPSLDGPPPSMHIIQAVTSDQEHRFIVNKMGDQAYFGDNTPQNTIQLTPYYANLYGTFDGYRDAFPQLWQSRVP